MTKSNIRKYEITYLFFFILLIYSLGNMFGEEKASLNLKVIVLFVVLFFVFLNQRARNLIRFFIDDRVSKKLFFLFVITGLIVTLARDGLFGSYILTLFLTFVSTLVFIQYLYRLPFEKAVNIFYISIFMVLLVNYYAHYIKVDTFILELDNRSINRRFTGYFGGGLAGALAGLSAVLSLIIYTTEYSKRNLFLIINIVLSWYAMLLADNRTSLSACVVIYILIFYNNSKERLLNKFVFLFVVLIAYFSYHYYLQSSTGGEQIDDDLEFRGLIWGLGYDQVLNNPIFGSGKENPFLNNFIVKSFDDSLADPHNSYLFFILKNGVFVSIFYFLFLFNFLFKSFNRLRNTEFFLYVYIALYWLIIAFTGGDYFNFSLNFSSVVFGISVFGILNHPGITLNIRS